MDDYHPRQRSTYALTLYRHNTAVDGRTVAVDYWDTAGQERFASMHPSYYYKAHACILVFDVTRKVTYTNLANWYKELRQYCESIPCICIANKIDVDYNVSETGAVLWTSQPRLVADSPCRSRASAGHIAAPRFAHVPPAQR